MYVEKTKDESKNENTVNSFLTMRGKIQKVLLVQQNAEKEEEKKQKQMKVNRISKLKEQK